jgi:hypothetical protein
MLNLISFGYGCGYRLSRIIKSIGNSEGIASQAAPVLFIVILGCDVAVEEGDCTPWHHCEPAPIIESLNKDKIGKRTTK